MIFDPAQQISPSPDDTMAPDFKPVDLLMSKYESMKLVEGWMKHRLSSISTGVGTEDFKYGVWQVTRGHAGLIHIHTSRDETIRQSLFSCRSGDA